PRELGLPQQIAPRIGTRVDVHVHRVAGLRAQEERGPADRQGFAGALERQAAAERPRQHLRDLAELAAAPDLVAERRAGGGLVLAGLHAATATEQLVLPADAG